MDSKRLRAHLVGIRHLLSHLQGEITILEGNYQQVLRVLQQAEELSDSDDLTGLLRRNSFLHKIEKLFKECRRLNETCGMLMIDIDHFKAVNDTHGHPTGDEVIKRIAALLKQYESPDCIVGRYGGEEFVMAIRGTDAKVLAVAELVRRGVERMHGPVVGPDGRFSSKVAWKCTLSVGMASSHKAGLDASRLLKGADEALYQAKRKGRNQVFAA